MQSLEFTKMSGCGNDFIIVDNRQRIVKDVDKGDFALALCRRRHSLGADGLIFVEQSRVAHIKMEYFNSDGSRGEMCGNGLRCFARFVAESEICPREMQVETEAGLYQARLILNDQVQIDMPPVGLPQQSIVIQGLPEFNFITVGVPHAVVFTKDSWDWTGEDLERAGRTIRHHNFFTKGTNVNFVDTQPDGTLKIRTFERGVEAETLACGTGATASALIASLFYANVSSPAMIQTKGGQLQVGFEKHNHGFIDIWLQGSARIIARGKICPDAYKL